MDSSATVEKQITPRHRSALLLSALILSFGALILGFFRFEANLRPRFAVISGSDVASAGRTLDLPTDFSDVAALEKKDTDRDGLNDHEELARFSTSPYLADSDSDGVPDKQEIDAGENPNCPRGEDCAPVPSTPKPVEPLGSILDDVAAASAGGGAVIGGVSDFTPPPFSPELAKTLLKTGGATDAQIAALDPTTLKMLYDEAVRSYTATGTVSVPTALRRTTEPVAPSTGTSPEAIRELLRGNGIAEDVIASMDDATLVKLFSSIVKE